MSQDSNQPQRVHPLPPAPPAWSAQGCLVMHPDATLPNRCIKCNQPCDSDHVRKKLVWVDPIVETHYVALRSIPYIRAFGIIILKWIDELRMRQSAVVYLGLCPAHRFRRAMAFWGMWVLLAAGVVVLYHTFGQMKHPSGLMMLVGTAACLLGIVWGSLGRRLVTAVYIGPDFVTLTGACDDFLKSLPSRDGPRAVTVS